MFTGGFSQRENNNMWSCCLVSGLLTLVFFFSMCSYGMKRSGRVRVQAAAGTEGPDLSVTVNGLKLPNPFVIASGPPGTNYTVMKRAFDEGWGAVIAKTVQFPQTFLFL
jgi:hypothetical protein